METANARSCDCNAGIMQVKVRNYRRSCREKYGATLVSTIAPAEPSPIAPAPIASPMVYRISVDEYERMVGLLDDDRVELIDGYLVRKMGKNPPHSWVTRELLDRLDQMLPSGWMWRQEQPVRIPEHDEPEPAIAIVRGANDDYKHRTPEPADIALLVEISDTTYDRDRGQKWIAYSEGGIAVYWIVNRARGRVEVYTDPSPSRIRVAG